MLGDLVDVRIATCRETGESKGFCFIEFVTRAAAKKALELNEAEMDGRWIVVDESEDRGRKGKGKGEDAGKPEGCLTVFVSGVSYETVEDTIYGEACMPSLCPPPDQT